MATGGNGVISDFGFRIWDFGSQSAIVGLRPARWCSRGSALAAIACAAALALAGAEPSPIQLKDVTKETGITFIHSDGSAGKRYVMEQMASGLARSSLSSMLAARVHISSVVAPVIVERT